MCGAADINASFRELVLKHLDEAFDFSDERRTFELLQYVDRDVMREFENGVKREFSASGAQPEYQLTFWHLEPDYDHYNVRKGMYVISR